MTNATFTNGFALLIGVGEGLPVTVQDATALKNVLIDPNRAAYPPQQVTLLTETSATRQNILAAFDQIITQVNQNPDATVIIYYSGHGGRIERTNEYFLVPYGYNSSQHANTVISGLEFTQKIEAIKARKLVVLLDCCHAGGVPVLKEPGETFVKSPVPPELLNVLETGRGRVVVASSRESESSYILQNARYSIFTECLLEALEGKASVKLDGYARIFDVLIYLDTQVPKRASPRPQHPLVSKMLQTDNFPLCYYAGGSKFLPGGTANTSSGQQILSGQSFDGQQRKELRLALIDAFPDIASLEQMLLDELNKNLREIAGEGIALQDIVFTLIKKAIAQGWVEDLVRGACNSNPGNPRLNAFARTIMP